VACSRYAVAKRSPKAAPKSNNDRALPVISAYRLHAKVAEVMSIMRAHDYGNFAVSAPFVDEIHTDDRIQGVSSTRIGAILSAPMKFKPAGTSDLQQKVADEIGGTNDQPGIWEEIVSTASAAECLKWGQHLGFGFGKIAWDKTAVRWQPRLVPWHPSSVRWDWMARRFIAQTERGGQVTLPRPDELPRGDGQWLVHCPYGVEYGWRSALLRSLCWKYISRQWTERDHDRLNERQGMGILKAQVPPGQSQPAQREDFFRQLENIGNEAVVMTTLDDKGVGFDVDVVEFVARTWESFNTRRDRLDTDIAIAILGQNLTTEVKTGSKAAALVHEVLRIDKALQDAKFAVVVRQQILTWYCEYNYGDPDLAPTPIYEVEPPDDAQGEALALKTMGEAGTQLLLANPRTDIEAIWETHGIPQISEEEMAAMEAEEAEAAAEVAAAAAKNAPPNGEGGGGDGGLPVASEDEEEEEEGKKPRAALSAIEVKKRYDFAGLQIAVENLAGSIRLWSDAEGKETGSTKMLCDYGFIEGHLSGDGEELDCYIGPMEAAQDVYVVHQLKAPDYRGHDEDKIFLGFSSAEEAKSCFLAHRDDQRAYGGMSVIPLDRFKVTLNRRAGSTRKIHASAVVLRARAATTRALVALAERSRGGAKARLRTAAGKERASRYQDALTKRAIEMGARALAPSLQHLFEHVNKAKSLSELEKKLPGLQHGMDLKGLATTLYQTNVLSKLAGIDAAKKET
jgi:phage gp29-like protein